MAMKSRGEEEQFRKIFTPIADEIAIEYEIPFVKEVDNSSFKEALELYITKKRYKVLFDTGKLRGDVYNTTCQDYSFAVGQAQTSLIMPSIDEMQSISNMWCSILDRNNEHINGFSNNGSKNVLKVQ